MRTEWVAASFAAVLLLGPAAHAAEPGLELSRDGRAWSSTLSEPLLAEDVRLVPGGSTRSDVWVRNSSGRTVTMTAFVRDSGTTLPDDVAPRDDFRASVAGTEVTGAQLSGCRVLATLALDPQEQRRVPVAIRLPSTSRNVSQSESLTLSLRVQLVAGEGEGPCLGGSGGSGDPGGSGGSGDPDSPDDERVAPPPERPGRVDTDGGLVAPPVVTEVLALGLLVALASVVGRRRWARIRGLILSRRGRARRGPRAS